MTEAPSSFQNLPLVSGRYRLVASLGSGGMGTISKAWDEETQSFVAIKRIHEAVLDDARIELFREEARVHAKLSSPHIAKTLGFASDETGLPYLVLEWIDGIDLSRWIATKKRLEELTSLAEAFHIFRGVLSALVVAHRGIENQGILRPVFHRDISPANVMIDRFGVVRLLDFGLARAMDRMGMTDPNILKGKVAYAAPELLQGLQADAKTDLFSFGVLAFELLTERRLFAAKTPALSMRAVLQGEIPDLERFRPDLPLGFRLLVARCLERSREARWPSAHEVLEDLERFRVEDVNAPREIAAFVEETLSRFDW